MSYCNVELEFTTATPDIATFDAFLDRVMDELEKIGIEADYTAVLAKHHATFTLPVSDLSADSMVKVITDLRTALHSAGCGTPGWLVEHRIVRTDSHRDLIEA
jgi:hypothetical protein